MLDPTNPLGVNKIGIDLMIFILIFLANCLQYDAIHDFSVWLITGSNSADINRFRSHRKLYKTLKKKSNFQLSDFEIFVDKKSKN